MYLNTSKIQEYKQTSQGHTLSQICPRANGAKRRSGRKPGARVTNRALAKSKVGSSRKGGHYVIFFEVVVKPKKNITKTRQTTKNNDKKDEYELDKHEVSKAPFFLSFRHSKCIVLSDFRQIYLGFVVAENKILTVCQHACTGLVVFKLPYLKANLGKSIDG